MRPVFSLLSPKGAGSKLSILIFHRVLATRDPIFPSEPTAEDFEAIVGWVDQWFNVLPLDEAAARLRHGSLPARAACITFDDGYADNYTVALPILARSGTPATFFIATGFLDGGRMWNDTVIEAIRRTARDSIDLTRLELGIVRTATLEEKKAAIRLVIPALKHRPPSARAHAVDVVADACDAALPEDLMMRSDQVRALHEAGMRIGAHTVTHPILAMCDTEAARREIAESRAHLESLLEEKVTLFAYPNGKPGRDYTPEHVRLAAALGFDAAVSTAPGVSRHGDDLFQLRRFTPWDRTRWRFGARMVQNLLRQAPGLAAAG